MAPPSKNSVPRQALIITTSPWERTAVGEHVHDIHEQEEPGGIIYECGRFQGTGSTWNIAIVELGLSDLDSATQMEIALRFFAPDVVLVVGTAFGIGVTLGDVVVAPEVIGFGSHDPDKGFNPLPAIEIASPRLKQRARFEAGKGTWPSRLGFNLPQSQRPRATYMASLATMAKGYAAEAPWFSFLQAHHPSVRAVDFDLYDIVGVLRASSVDALIVRGIHASIAPPEVVTSFEDRQRLAARYAAAFAFQVLAKLGSAVPLSQRSPRPLDSPAKQYVVRLVIENLRSITAADWQIEPSNAAGWHVVLGDNGSGKSTFLRALALTLFSRTETDALRQDWTTWLRLESTEGQATTTLRRAERGSNGGSTPANQDLEIQLVGVQRVLRLGRAPEPDPESEDAGPRPVACTPEASSSDAFSVAYGPFRRFSGGDIDFEKEFAAHPRLTRHLSLFSERAALTEGLAWLKDLRFKQLEQRPDGDLLDTVRKFINHSLLLPHGARLEEVSSEAVTFADGNGCIVPIEELSDGFRSILSLTLDLLRHFAAAFDPADVFSHDDATRVVAPGVVLIDEIDAHLHPTWQHAVGHWFRAHFPNVQFIVATHSPLICQAADTVFLLPRPGSGDTGRMLAGIELDRVRYGNVLDAYGTGVFGIGVTRSEESKQMLRRLAELNTRELETDLTPEEQSEQERLQAILPTAARNERGTDGKPDGTSANDPDSPPGAP